MGMILHDWNLEKKMQLIRAAYEALPPGGAFIAVEAAMTLHGQLAAMGRRPFKTRACSRNTGVRISRRYPASTTARPACW